MARFSNGWIKVYRSLGEGDLVQNPFLLALWVRLLTWAHWKPSKIMWDGKQRDLPAGAVVFGFRELAQQWDCSTSTIHKWSHYLHKTDRITLETGTRGSLAIIRNWEIYQSQDDDVRTPAEHGANAERTPAEHGANLIEEVKKEERNNVPLDFEPVWKNYPRKTDRSAALERFLKRIKSAGDYASLQRAVIHLAAHVAETRKELKYVKHLATFLGTEKSQPWREWVDGIPEGERPATKTNGSAERALGLLAEGAR